MPTFTVYGQRLAERARALPPPAVDAVIAIVCLLYVVFQAAVRDRFLWWALALGVANSAPLLWRRRHPFAVALICGFSTTWLALAQVLHQLPAAQLVATYTFAALCPPMWRLLGVLCTVAGVTASILIPKDEFLNLGLVGIAFSVAYALGTGARARRDRISMLEERARRLAEQQDAAAARERERIARDMHDILAHSMSMVVIQAEAGPVAVRSAPDKAEEAFDTISETAREALAQLRRTLGVLRSGEPERRPTPGLESLSTLVDGVRGTGLQVTLEEDGPSRPVPADIAATAYRIVQESLTNTVKHATAGAVAVRLGWRTSTLVIEVCDDGAGAGAATGSGGHGLVGMRERVAAAGGELSFGPGPAGTGFRVRADLPLN